MDSPFQEFHCSHDLAEGVQGKALETVLIVREGVGYRVLTDDAFDYIPGGIVLDVLQQLGDAIVSRLRACDDPRAVAASQAWEARASRDAEGLAAVATGWKAETLYEVAGSRDLGEFFAMGAANTCNNELLVAARMSICLGPELVSRMIELLRSAPRVNAVRLDRLTRVAEGRAMTASGKRPHDQGYELASWLRSYPKIVGFTGRVDPEDILAEWGVPVQDVDLGIRQIDGLACWGPNHGPAVFVNSSGEHARRAAGRRNTLAHEICHLLVDRHGALPAAEVLGGRVAGHVEARARAFAAELLLPRQVAGRLMVDFADDPKARMARLTSRYGVSQEVVAWQVRNSDEWVDATTFAFLRSKVSQPWRF